MKNSLNNILYLELNRFNVILASWKDNFANISINYDMTSQLSFDEDW